MEITPTVGFEPTIPELVTPWLQLVLTGLLVLGILLFVAVQLSIVVGKVRGRKSTPNREAGK